MNSQRLDSQMLGGFLRDLAFKIMEQAEEARKDMCCQVGRKGEEFAAGYVTAFYAVLSTIKFRAEALDIPLDKIGFPGMDPDRYTETSCRASHASSGWWPFTWLRKWLQRGK